MLCSSRVSATHLKIWHPYTKIDELVQERRNSSALAMELRLSCINPSKWTGTHHQMNCTKTLVQVMAQLVSNLCLTNL